MTLLEDVLRKKGWHMWRIIDACMLGLNLLQHPHTHHNPASSSLFTGLLKDEFPVLGSDPYSPVHTHRFSFSWYRFTESKVIISSAYFFSKKPWLILFTLGQVDFQFYVSTGLLAYCITTNNWDTRFGMWPKERTQVTVFKAQSIGWRPPTPTLWEPALLYNIYRTKMVWYRW